MGALGTPLHLLPLGKALGNKVIHRRFDKAGADSVSLAIALAVVGDEYLIVGNVGNQQKALKFHRIYRRWSAIITANVSAIHAN